MDIHKYKEKLEQIKGELEKEIKPLEEEVPEFGSDIDHFEEESNEAEEFSNNLSVAKVIRERLANVETALEKIEKGTYGTCEKCKKPIKALLLDIDPESRYCKECKLAMNNR